jgi:hypothetical protein
LNAVVKPKWQRLRTELTQSVTLDRVPLETITLEAEECLRWLDEEGKEGSLTWYLMDSVNELEGKKRAKFDVLIAKLMTGAMTADELIDFRDLQRSALIDYCSSWARRVVEEELL